MMSAIAAPLIAAIAMTVAAAALGQGLGQEDFIAVCLSNAVHW